MEEEPEDESNNHIGIEEINPDDLYRQDEENDPITEQEIVDIQRIEFLNSNSSNSFIELANGDKFHKAKLVYLLQNGNVKASSDITRRFIMKNQFQMTDLSSVTTDMTKNDHISKGDYILIVHERNFYHGRVINFKYLKYNNKNDSIYYRNFITISSEGTRQAREVGVLLDPIHALDFRFVRQPFQNTFTYYSSNSYLCHLNKNTDFSSREIKDFVNSCI